MSTLENLKSICDYKKVLIASKLRLTTLKYYVARQKSLEITLLGSPWLGTLLRSDNSVRVNFWSIYLNAQSLRF